jgi:hypothetical protein
MQMIEDQTDMLPDEIHGAMSEFETEMWARHRRRYRERALNAYLCIAVILGLSLILWAAIWEGGTRVALWALS